MTRALLLAAIAAAVLLAATAHAAQMQGIVVLQLGTGQVDHQHVTEIIDWIKKGVRA